MNLVFKLLAVTLLITRCIVIYDNVKRIKENKDRKKLGYDDSHTRF